MRSSDILQIKQFETQEVFEKLWNEVIGMLQMETTLTLKQMDESLNDDKFASLLKHNHFTLERNCHQLNVLKKSWQHFHY